MSRCQCENAAHARLACEGSASVHALLGCEGSASVEVQTDYGAFNLCTECARENHMPWARTSTRDVALRLVLDARAQLDKAAELLATPKPPPDRVDPDPKPDPKPQSGLEPGTVVAKVHRRAETEYCRWTLALPPGVTRPPALEVNLCPEPDDGPLWAAVQVSPIAGRAIECIAPSPVHSDDGAPVSFQVRIAVDPPRDVAWHQAKGGAIPFPHLAIDARGAPGPWYAEERRRVMHDFGPYRRCESRFFVLNGLNAWIEHETIADRYAVCDLVLGNTSRYPDDVYGTRTLGQVFLDDVILEAVSGYVIVMAHERPGLPPGPHRSVSLSGEYFPPRRKHEVRFAIVPADDSEAIAEARNALAFLDRGRASGPWSYAESGGWGPEDAWLATFTDSYRHGSGASGQEAVRVMAEVELAHLKAKLASGQGALGLFHPDGELEGGEPGGTHVLINAGHWQEPAWWECCQIHSEMWGDRHPEMLHAKTGDPLTIHAVAAANEGRQPWVVRRTPGADRKADISIPWPEDIGFLWNKGAAPEKEMLDKYQDIDSAHAVRLIAYLLVRIWSLNSFTARRLLRSLVAHYQFAHPLAPTPRPDHLTIPALEAYAEAHPGEGHGGLGRQTAWVKRAFAAAWLVSDDRWRGREAEWIRRFMLAQAAICSPAGGRRRRVAPSWGWANPAPQLPADSKLVVDQTFEMVYEAVGDHSLARAFLATPSPLMASVVPAMRAARAMFERTALGLHVTEVRHTKFAAYGEWEGPPSPSAEETLQEIALALHEQNEGRPPADLSKRRSFETLLYLEDDPGDLGDPHQGNLCALGLRNLLAMVRTPEQNHAGYAERHFFFRQACRWVGLKPDGTTLADYVGHVFGLTGKWAGPHGHENTVLWWSLDMIAFAQHLHRVALRHELESFRQEVRR